MPHDPVHVAHVHAATCAGERDDGGCEYEAKWSSHRWVSCGNVDVEAGSFWLAPPGRLEMREHEQRSDRDREPNSPRATIRTAIGTAHFSGPHGDFRSAPCTGGHWGITPPSWTQLMPLGLRPTLAVLRTEPVMVSMVCTVLFTIVVVHAFVPSAFRTTPCADRDQP